MPRRLVDMGCRDWPHPPRMPTSSHGSPHAQGVGLLVGKPGSSPGVSPLDEASRGAAPSLLGLSHVWWVDGFSASSSSLHRPTHGLGLDGGEAANCGMAFRRLRIDHTRRRKSTVQHDVLCAAGRRRLYEVQQPDGLVRFLVSILACARDGMVMSGRKTYPELTEIDSAHRVDVGRMMHWQGTRGPWFWSGWRQQAVPLAKCTNQNELTDCFLSPQDGRGEVSVFRSQVQTSRP